MERALIIDQLKGQIVPCNGNSKVKNTESENASSRSKFL